MKRTRMRRVSKKRRAVGPAYLAFRLNLLARANYRCEYCRWKGALDVHHCAKPRARYLLSFDHAIALCRPCHDLTEASYATGRLVVTPLGQGRFHCELVRGGSKFARRESLARRLTESIK